MSIQMIFMLFGGLALFIFGMSQMGEGLQKAAEELDLLKLSPEERAAYESYIEDRRVGESSIKTSWLEGKRDGKLEVARNLQAAGVALEVIMQTTGLSREEIENSK